MTTINFKIVGTCDFLPKMGYKSLESFTTDPLYNWWNTYLIKSKMESIKALPDIFVVVDNLDADGEWFIVKDISSKSYTMIHEGCTPCIVGDAEVTPAKSGTYVHIPYSDVRKVVADKIKELKNISDEVYVLTSIYPSLEVCDYMMK